jgi:hypothetical protein
MSKWIYKGEKRELEYLGYEAPHFADSLQVVDVR